MKMLIVILSYMILLGLSFTLGWYAHGGWFFLAVLLGINLIQSAFTDACPIVGLANSLAGEKDEVPPPPSDG